MRHLCLIGLTASLLFSAPNSHVDPVTPDDPGLADFTRAYQTDDDDISRYNDVRWSEARTERLTQMYSQWLEKLAAVDFDKLGQDGKLDYILLRNEIQNRRAHLELDQRRLEEMEPLLPFRKQLQELEWARRRMEDIADPSKPAAVIAAIPEQVKAVRAQLDKGRRSRRAATQDSDDSTSKPAEAEVQPLKVTPVVAQRTASAVDDLRRALRQWSSYYEGYKPDFSWWLKEPREEADKALADYAKYLRETVAGIKGDKDDPLLGDPIGEKALLDDLAAEHIAYTPKQLIAIAEKEFAWCEAEMKKASNEMGCGDDWKAALAKVKEDHVPPGQQDQFVRDEARAAIAYLKEHDLITIPPLCEETWRVEMLSPETQRTLPFAVYGGQHVGVSYPTDTMTNEDKLMSMRGNNKHFTHIVAPHELIPGHHLQGFQSDRYRPYRQLFRTPFLIEGWALYWEIKLWDLGWGRTPQERIGMLFWRQHRCARIIVSLKFHLGEMTPAEMINFLVDRVGHERFGATSEVRRFIGGAYSPLYQCGYMIGGLQLRSLHEEVIKSGKMIEKQFNDAIMTYGPIPIEIIRAGVLDTPLTRDAKPVWMFAGE